MSSEPREGRSTKLAMGREIKDRAEGAEQREKSTNGGMEFNNQFEGKKLPPREW
jgi:hypothetical protein